MLLNCSVVPCVMLKISVLVKVLVNNLYVHSVIVILVWKSPADDFGKSAYFQLYNFDLVTGLYTRI